MRKHEHTHTRARTLTFYERLKWTFRFVPSTIEIVATIKRKITIKTRLKCSNNDNDVKHFLKRYYSTNFLFKWVSHFDRSSELHSFSIKWKRSFSCSVRRELKIMEIMEFIMTFVCVSVCTFYSSSIFVTFALVAFVFVFFFKSSRFLFSFASDITPKERTTFLNIYRCYWKGKKGNMKQNKTKRNAFNTFTNELTVPQIKIILPSTCY